MKAESTTKEVKTFSLPQQQQITEASGPIPTDVTKEEEDDVALSVVSDFEGLTADD